MKILLVYPPIFRSADLYSTPLPTGMLQVGAYLRQQGHEVAALNLELGGAQRTVSIRQLRDGYAQNNPQEYIHAAEAAYRQEFRQALRRFGPEIVGFSCATEQIEAAEVLSQDARAIDTSIRIEIGGMHHTSSPWAQEVSQQSQMHDPALDLLAGQNPPESFGAVLTSLGCPHACTYCGSPNKYARRLTEYPIEQVERRIRDAIAMGAEKIHLMDDSVTLRRARALEIADLMHRIGRPWRTQTRADDLCRHPDLAKLFKDRGCTQLTFGAESGSARILDEMKKKTTPDHYRKAVKILNSADMPYTANFMIGYPGETDDDVALTTGLIRELAPRRVLAGSVVPYPGTELYQTHPDWVRQATAWPYCRWSPFDPGFLRGRQGERIGGPSAAAIDEFYALVEQVNDHAPTPGTFTTILKDTSTGGPTLGSTPPPVRDR